MLQYGKYLFNLLIILFVEYAESGC